MIHKPGCSFVLWLGLAMVTGCAEQQVAAVRPGDELVWLPDGPTYVSSLPARCDGKVAVNHGQIAAVAPLPFDFDRANLRPDATDVLDCVARAEIDQPTAVRVQGHTDSTGTADYNQGLGERRAMASAVYLQQQGVPAQLMTTESYGESNPVASNASAEGRALNRRVNIVPAND